MKSLFKSQTSYKLIQVFCKEPKAEFTLSEIAKEVKKDAANVSRELQKLMEEGLVKQTEFQGKKYYSFELESTIAKEVQDLFCKIETNQIDKQFNREWILGEDIPNIDPYFSKIWLDCFVNNFEKYTGRAYKHVAAVYKDYYLWFYYDHDDSYEVGENLVNKFEENPSFMDEVNEGIIQTADALSDYIATIPQEGLEKLSNQELWDIYKQQEDLHTEYYQWGWIPPAADMFHGNLTERGKKILRDLGVEEDKINETLTLLTHPINPSLIKQEQDALKRMAIRVQKDSQQLELFKEIFRKFKEEDVKLYGLYTHTPEYEKKFEEVVRSLVNQIDESTLEDLQDHYMKYYYTAFLFTEEQGTYSFEHYLKELVRIVNREPNLEEQMKKDEEEEKELLKQREDLIQSLELNQKARQFFTAWGEFMVTKIYRRYAQLYALASMIPVLEEMAKRVNLTLKEFKFMMIDEVEQAMKTGQVNRQEIQARIPFSAVYRSKDSYQFYTDKEAEQAISYIEKNEEYDVEEITGQCGSQGFASGTVKIVNTVEDMKKMEEGDILVSISTQPDLLPAMKKAAAFVTEQGGVTSHAAIVAREMKTPCLIGTKIATKALKDGMKVTVDATKGVLYIDQK